MATKNCSCCGINRDTDARLEGVKNEPPLVLLNSNQFSKVCEAMYFRPTERIVLHSLAQVANRR